MSCCSSSRGRAMACSGRGVLGALARGVLQKITQQPWTLGREDALGMKLHALHHERAVAHRHDLRFRGLRTHLELRGQRRGSGDQRMIAPHLARLRQTLEQRALIVTYERGLAVHEPIGPHDLAPEHFHDGLVSEAYPEHRDAPGERADQDRKSTRLNSSHLVISYAVFCLKKKNKKNVSILETNSKHFYLNNILSVIVPQLHT